MGADVNYVFNTDPISIWLANQKSMDAKLPPFIKMVGEEFDKVKPGVASPLAHVGIGRPPTLRLPDRSAAARHQEVWRVDPDALRKAALDVDLPEGGTMLGFASSSSPKARGWLARTSARSRSSSSMSTTNRYVCGHQTPI